MGTHDVAGKLGSPSTGAGDGAELESPEAGRTWGHQTLYTPFWGESGGDNDSHRSLSKLVTR